MVKNVSYAAPWFCMLETVAYFLQQLSRNQDVPLKILLVISDISRKLRYKPSVFPWNCFCRYFGGKVEICSKVSANMLSANILSADISYDICWCWLRTSFLVEFLRTNQFFQFTEKKKNQSFSSFSSSLYVCFGWHC